MVQYPSMRKMLIDYLGNLSDREYQRRVWVNHESSKPGYCDSFGELVHFFYDDTVLAKDPYKGITYYLEDEKEAEAVRKVIATLDMIFAKYGTHKTDEQYITYPEWLDVIEAAQNARAVVTEQ